MLSSSRRVLATRGEEVLFADVVSLEERSFKGDERFYNLAFPKAGRWAELLVATHFELLPRANYLWLGF